MSVAVAGKHQRVIPLLVTSICVVALAGCSKRDDLDGKRRQIAGLGERGQVHVVPDQGKSVILDLYDNRAAAVVHANNALVMDCGTADFAKYVEGAYRSAWHMGAEDGGNRVALPDGKGGDLYFPLDADAGGIARGKDGEVFIHFRVRPVVKKQLVSVLLNEKRLGDVRLRGTALASYAVRAPASLLREGENRLRFYFKHKGKISGRVTAAAFHDIRIGAKSAAKTTSTMKARKASRAGKVIEALSVSGPSRISYYIAVPTMKPALALAVAGADTKLAVQISSREGSSKLWEGQGGAAWTNVNIDLTSYAGTVVRLDLLSQGAADWARPRVLAVKQAQAKRKTNWQKPDHVIVWTVSSLRMDRFAGRKVPTPAFSRFLERAVLFSKVTAAAPSPASAHVALLTGSYPQGSRIDNERTTLAERFRDTGYRTALISGNGFVNDDAGFAQGFDLYLNPMRRRHPFGAKILWRRARRYLARYRNNKTLMYIATVEPHLPYTPKRDSLSQEWKRGEPPFSAASTAKLVDELAKGRRLTLAERDYVTALYNAEVRDIDAAFGRMLSDLDKLGITNKTAIIFVADHGEELFERGGIGHGSHLFEEVLHVPAAIALPGQSGARNIEVDVESIDLYATILDLAGITPNPENQGQSLLPLLISDAVRPRPTFAHIPGRGRAMKLGRYKLMVPLRGAHRLYDLRGDPKERNNLMGTRPLLERYLRNVFGIGVAYQRAWSRDRWGTPDNVSATFAADHGL